MVTNLNNVQDDSHLDYWQIWQLGLAGIACLSCIIFMGLKLKWFRARINFQEPTSPYKDSDLQGPITGTMFKQETNAEFQSYQQISELSSPSTSSQQVNLKQPRNLVYNPEVTLKVRSMLNRSTIQDGKPRKPKINGLPYTQTQTQHNNTYSNNNEKHPANNYNTPEPQTVVRKKKPKKDKPIIKPAVVPPDSTVETAHSKTELVNKSTQNYSQEYDSTSYYESVPTSYTKSENEQKPTNKKRLVKNTMKTQLNKADEHELGEEDSLYSQIQPITKQEKPKPILKQTENYYNPNPAGEIKFSEQSRNTTEDTIINFSPEPTIQNSFESQHETTEKEVIYATVHKKKKVKQQPKPAPKLVQFDENISSTINDQHYDDIENGYSSIVEPLRREKDERYSDKLSDNHPKEDNWGIKIVNKKEEPHKKSVPNKIDEPSEDDDPLFSSYFQAGGNMYSSQAASIFFGTQAQPPNVKPPKVPTRRFDSDNESNHSQTSA